MIPQEYWKYFPARKLPEINLAGTRFFLDLRLWECRDVDDFSNKFSLDDLYPTSKGFICCFDLTTKNLFHGSREEYEQRKQELSIVQLPSISKMDPVGYRAMMGLAPQKQGQPLLEKKRIRKSKGKRL
ncbi:MAG: hypothetical protein I8H66_11460 [Sphingobacteriia bacterium]|nr:hypothetical protein [Sphingobacteriia bacterium]